MQVAVIFYDGYCKLCNRSVRFILSKDKKQKFKFVAQQAPFAQNFLTQNNISKLYPERILLFDEGKIYDESTAVLRIAKNLGFPYSMAYAFIIVPPFIRDFFYRIVARNRYHWFGKLTACPIPDERFKSRFIDSEDVDLINRLFPQQTN